MRSALAVLVALALGLPMPALADKKPKSKGKDKDSAVSVVFTTGEREKARLYFVETNGRGKCPPGLAKKNNGCLPPGQASKRYVVGKAVPAGVPIRDLPDDLVIRIGAPPVGYRYALVDGDLVKLAIGTMLVVDAIEGLVN